MRLVIVLDLPISWQPETSHSLFRMAPHKRVPRVLLTLKHVTPCHPYGLRLRSPIERG